MRRFIRTIAAGWLTALAIVAASSVAQPPGGEQKNPKAKHQQSEEVQAFRKTAVNVTFPSDGRELKGWIYKPAGDGPFPVVIWNHGSERKPTAHPELGKFYTSHGFVLFLPVRRGHGNSPGTYIQDAFEQFRKEVNDPAKARKKIIELQEECNKDVAAAVDWVKTQPYADKDRVAVTGCSYGGIQTILTAEKPLGLKACIPFAPAAMSWANTDLRERLEAAIRNAKAPLFLIQAKNDYSTGPSEVLGPQITGKSGLNRAKLYPEFGTTHAEGHGGFACWEEGVAIWGPDVLAFLKEAGMTRSK